tara:strand:+ start:147 stop:278 length:132 start_codon:yes stop_codon:yes gene_type:complete
MLESLPKGMFLMKLAIDFGDEISILYRASMPEKLFSITFTTSI